MPLDMSQLIPGANFGGSSQNVPVPGSTDVPAVGGQTSPFGLNFPGGANTSPMTSTMSAAPGTTATSPGGTDINSLIQNIFSQGFAANNVGPGQMGSPGGAQGGPAQGGGLGGFNLASMFGLGSGDPNAAHNFVKAMHKAGFSSGVAGQLWNFLQSGAGFNPQVAQAMIDAMQPQVKRGEADILEQFGSKGLGMSSAAAIGLGDYLSQVNLNEQAIFAQMIEQATQNYMQVLMGGKGNPPKGFFDNYLSWITAVGSLVPK